MRIFLFLFLFLLSNQAVSQGVVNDYYIKKSLKQDDLQYEFCILDEAQKGILYFKRNKFYYWYKAQKVLVTQGGASGQLLHGKFECFYVNKQLAQRGNFYKGLKNGVWLYWREDGILLRKEFWKRGKYNSKQVLYDEEGKAAEVLKYGWFRSKIEREDSTFVIRRRYARGEIGSWEMDEGKWKLEEGRKKEKVKEVKKEKGKSKKEESNTSTSSGEQKESSKKEKNSEENKKKVLKKDKSGFENEKKRSKSAKDADKGKKE